MSLHTYIMTDVSEEASLEVANLVVPANIVTHQWGMSEHVPQ